MNRRESDEELWHLLMRHVRQISLGKGFRTPRRGLVCKLFNRFVRTHQTSFNECAKKRFCDDSRCLKASPLQRSKVGVSNVEELCPKRTVWELVPLVERNFSKFSRHSSRETELTGLLSFSKVLWPLIVLIDNLLISEAWWVMVHVGRMYSLKHFVYSVSNTINW